MMQLSLIWVGFLDARFEVCVCGGVGGGVKLLSAQAPLLCIQNPKNDNDVIIFRHDVNVNFFDIVLFLLSSLVTGPSFMSISSLVLEL